MNPFGPVLTYDLIRMARRGRYFWMRSLYALALLGVLYLLWRNSGLGAANVELIRQRLAVFGERFVRAFMMGQFAIVMVMTPACVADAIAEEKERRTLDYLFTTHLRNREIVLGKLLARLAHLVFFLLAGLPVLSFTLFFGGVSAELLWGGFAATGLTMLSVAGVSLWQSLYAEKARDAIVRTYVVLACYCVIWGLLEYTAELVWGGGLISDRFRGRHKPSALWEICIALALAAARSGNPLALFVKLEEHASGGASYGQILPGLLTLYAIFHGSIAAATIGLTIWKLRRADSDFFLRPLAYLGRVCGRRWRTALSWLRIRQIDRAITNHVSQRQRSNRWRNLGDAPMWWKEVRADPGFHLGRTGKVVAALLVVGALLPGLLILFTFTPEKGKPIVRCAWSATYSRDHNMHIYAQSIGTGLLAIGLLGVSVRAAGSVGMERGRQSLESLLASPLTNGEILRAKWWGSVLSVRHLVWLLAIIWLLACSCAGMDWRAAPVLMAAWCIYAAFVASLGMFWSVLAKTTTRAVLGTIGTLLGICGLWFIQMLMGSTQPYRNSYAGGWTWLAVGLAAADALLLLAALTLGLIRIARNLRHLDGWIVLVCCIFLTTVIANATAELWFAPTENWRAFDLEADFFAVAPPVTNLIGCAFHENAWKTFDPDLLPRVVYRSRWYGTQHYYALLSGRDRIRAHVIIELIGFATYLAATYILWRLAVRRFRKSCGRIDR